MAIKPTQTFSSRQFIGTDCWLEWFKRAASEVRPPFAAGQDGKRPQTNHDHTSGRSEGVNLTLFSPAIEISYLFSDQYCCLFDGDRRARYRT